MAAVFSPSTLARRLGVVGLWLATAACAPMESSGDPLKPVPVQAIGASDAPSDAAPADPELNDPAFADFDGDALVMSSEDLRGDGPPPAPEPAPVAPVPVEAVAAAAPVAEPAPPPVAAAPPVAAPPPMVVSAGSSAAGWPVRLVRTLPDTQPPRAILGFADGREIVVTPGAMVADQKLVVMSIGRRSLELARVAANGDHAVITQTTLTAQY